MATGASADRDLTGRFPADLRRTILADRDGVIRAWGADWADAFGYAESEALGQSLDLIVPEGLQSLHWRGFMRAMHRGSLKRQGATLKVPAVHKDGSVIAVRFVDGALVISEDGTVEGITLAFQRRDPAWVGFVYRVALRVIALARSLWSRLKRPRSRYG